MPASSRILEVEQGYAKTIVLAPAGRATRSQDLRGVADVIVRRRRGRPRSSICGQRLRALRERGIYSVLCEGGPTLGGTLIAAGLVDRFYWAIAPRLLGKRARGAGAREASIWATLRRGCEFDRVERVGDDVVLSGRPFACLAGLIALSRNRASIDAAARRRRIRCAFAARAS